MFNILCHVVPLWQSTEALCKICWAFLFMSHSVAISREEQQQQFNGFETSLWLLHGVLVIALKHVAGWYRVLEK